MRKHILKQLKGGLDRYRQWLIGRGRGREGLMHGDKQSESGSDSEWSELQRPGNSQLDKMINERNRFNLHYHKGDIINIPQTNRIPLLPNEEDYDWIEERKLMSIERVYRTKTPQDVVPEPVHVPRPHLLLEDEPLLLNLHEEWEGMSDAQKESVRKQESLAVLSSFATAEVEDDIYRELKMQEILEEECEPRSKIPKSHFPDQVKRKAFQRLDEEDEPNCQTHFSAGRSFQSSRSQESNNVGHEWPTQRGSKTKHRNAR